MKRRCFCLLLAGWMAGGCAYVADRGLDLAQVANLSLGLSEGVDLSVRVTKVAQAGVGSYRGLFWFGLKDGLFDAWEEERSEFGVGPLYIHEVFRDRGARLLAIRYPLFADPGFREYALDVTHLSDRGWFGVGATVNFIFLGLDVSFELAELADFFAGLGGSDLLDDDVHTPSPEALCYRLSGEDARVRAAAARALRLRYGEDFGYVIYSAPDQKPAWQIAAIDRWREFLGFAPARASREPVEALSSPAPESAPPASSEGR